ncbi:MAG: hypothetical protein WEB06_10200 [Actinomycetota bacterium]
MSGAAARREDETKPLAPSDPERDAAIEWARRQIRWEHRMDLLRRTDDRNQRVHALPSPATSDAGKSRGIRASQCHS